MPRHTPVYLRSHEVAFKRSGRERRVAHFLSIAVLSIRIAFTGDTVSSIAVGALWTAVAPQAGFVFGAAFALLALLTLTALRAPGA